MSVVAPVTITCFTDPMMGLSYEWEPVHDRVRQQFGDAVAFEYVMGLLVRDVSDFMTPEELALPPEEGIRRYNERLAQIYLSEVPLGGRPMNMRGFSLFSPERRSSELLCLAFHAARIACPDLAERYLLALREATVMGVQTTRREELVRVAEETGVDLAEFESALDDGRSRSSLDADLELCRKLGVCGLPAYRLSNGERSIQFEGLVPYETLKQVISNLLGPKGD